MDNQQPTQPTQQQPAQSNEPKPFRLYTGKAPLLIQIVGGLLWLFGTLGVISGIVGLFLFRDILGIISIILGVFEVKYGRLLFKMEEKGYKGALVVIVLGIVLNIVIAVMAGLGVNVMGGVGMSVIMLIALYLNREKFVKA